MKRDELYSFVNAYTEKELYFLENGMAKELNPPEYWKYNKKADDMEATYLFESDYFMDAGEEIGINRQDRFEAVLPHAHNYIELNFVWSGKCVQNIEGKQVISQAGDVCIFDREAVHSIEAASEEDIVVNVMMRKEYFDGAFLSRMTKQGIVSEFLMDAVTKSRKKKHYLFFETRSNPKVRQLMEEILMEFYNRGLGYKEALDSYMVLLFTELLRNYLTDTKERETEKSPHMKLLSVLAYIEKHYETCALQDTADHFGFNGAYLTSLLKEKTGRSFVEHLQEQRLNRARMLLQNTDIPVTEIVNLCGYSNMHFFYNKFKKAENCTPKEYRVRKQKT